MKPKLSIFETLSLIIRVAIAPAKLTLAVTRSLTIAQWRRLPLNFYFRTCVARLLLTFFTPRQLQFIQPAFPETYEKWIASKIRHLEETGDIIAARRLLPSSEQLDTCSIFWIGDHTKASKIVLFFHGGGYICPLLAGHLEWCYEACVVAGAEVGIEVAVAVLQYTLVPEARYPAQLKQAVLALNHLLQTGIEPRNLIIGGDSAGGNLTMQVFGHLLHPHPDVMPLEINEPFSAAFTISPWLNTTTDLLSYKENRNIDMLTPEFIHDIARQAIFGPEFQAQIRDNMGWAAPLEVDGAWFDGLGKVVRRLYVTGGKQEILRDHIIQFAQTVQHRNANVDVRLEIAEKEAHDFVVFEAEAGIVGEATKRMKIWVTRVLTN